MSEPQRPARFPLAELFGAEGDVGDLADAFGAPLFWPDLAADRAAEEWQALAGWVAQLVARFDWDTHVIPACWWRHNHLVEALAALRDHERGCYAPTAPPTGAVEFQRALRDIEDRLKTWVADLRCDARHDPSHDRPRRLPFYEFDDWVAADAERRGQHALDAALADT
jgi:hypothetical protein